MKKCDKCDKPANLYLTEIIGGKKIQKHLCEDCAAAEGITVKSNVPIHQLLEDFILQGSASPQATDITCKVCGLTFKEFRQQGLLGCPNDYDAFAAALEPLIARAQEGASQHIGKAPRHADADQVRHQTILRLRGELRSAVAAEDYERAAAIRDQIKELEGS